jgi:hypothetical protein
MSLTLPALLLAAIAIAAAISAWITVGSPPGRRRDLSRRLAIGGGVAVVVLAVVIWLAVIAGNISGW